MHIAPLTIALAVGLSAPAFAQSGRITPLVDAAWLKVNAGKENVVVSEPTMGGEDFSEYGRQGVPILMYRLGAVDSRRLERFQQLGQKPPSLHSPVFYPDVEEALTTGVATMSAAVLELMGK